MSLPLSPFAGTVYRAHNPRWAFDPESGDGASRHGGRFNRPGTAALYTSLRPETAWLEAQQAFPFKAQPMTLCAYDVHCAAILDLTSRSAREAASTSTGELVCAWEDMVSRNIEPPTWTLARRLMADGVAGIIVPSFAYRAGNSDHNLVLWRWSRRRPYRVRVVDDYGRLPRDDRSWGGGKEG